ncbi:peptide-methionine (R)-S-oxide reductase MsrB [Loktanella sp. TSTF-M6]|uniref:peptide-methionine (R)-S-oxide reductase n=1 Tax=Loktanella gaetbuli TaxID=2881335 RepID=A0ABS8BPK0_9RHOB|nr:peptide-methionine (R)-S-oxide reductase MsrB [Loktanella gaetbuli]MCB5197651.1 peptide-methionine (R)-S-oxide reductase MsrB [Loktanella gaetbuli]
MNRRMFIATALAATTAPAALVAQQFEVTRTDAQWRAMLTQAEYNVMRREGTERAGSSPLDKNTAEGVYHCRGCDLALYPSRTKFDSSTGWPSFYASYENALGTKVDRKIGVARTELHCRRCGSHLGHVFNDGPPPTGQRHCINGVSLVFRAA